MDQLFFLEALNTGWSCPPSPPMMKKKQNKKTHKHETLKLRTNVNIECDWKLREDWRLGFKTKKKHIKKINTTLQFIYVSNILSYHASPAESTVTNSSPLFWIITPSECPEVIEIVTWDHFQSIFWIETRGQAKSFPVVWLWPKQKNYKKSWDLAVLLWEIVWCILLNARRRPQPITAACEGLAKLGCQPHLWVSSILPLIMHPSSHLCAADVCVWTSSSHSELHSLLCRSLHIIAPSSLFLFTVWH